LDTATEWCAKNQDWEYTGNWNNRRTDDNTKEVSFFEVRKKVNVVEPKEQDSKSKDTAQKEVKIAEE